jgi:hypothetical protein
VQISLHVRSPGGTVRGELTGCTADKSASALPKDVCSMIWLIPVDIRGGGEFLCWKSESHSSESMAKVGNSRQVVFQKGICGVKMLGDDHV